MVKQPRKRCIHPKCNELAIWGLPGQMVACEAHKSDGHVNLVEKPCVSCKNAYILNAEGYCYACRPGEMKRVRKAKETQMVHSLVAQGWVPSQVDAVVERGMCGRERPDVVFDLGTHILIVECDETQHKDYRCECKQVRMINVGQAFGGLRILFLRFNPDDY
jgi:hypothetical protein